MTLKIMQTEKKTIKTCEDLKVYQLSFELAMQVFEVSKKIPREERYSLTDQIRRSSRSITINIREGYAKRKYENVFVRHLNDAYGSCEETKGWLEFSVKCGYLPKVDFDDFLESYDQLGAMIYTLMRNWKGF